MLWPGYKAEKVCNEPSVWVSAPEPMSAAMTDETPLESSPPDSETPTGTSAIMWRRMTRSNSSPKRAGVLGVGSRGGELGVDLRLPVLRDGGPAVGGNRHVVAG